VTFSDWIMRARANEVNAGVGKWRSRALKAMLAAVDRMFVLHGNAPNWPPSRDEVLAVVDAAYPFGERKHHPYKAWLEERKLLIEALMRPAPTQDEYEVLKVVTDLVEEGRYDEAEKLADEQAPNRHGRKCPVCGRPRGSPCREPDLESYGPLFGMAPKFKDRIVPHEARIQPEENT